MTVLRQNRQALLLYKTTSLKGTDRRKLVILIKQIIIKSSLIVICLHDIISIFVSSQVKQWYLTYPYQGSKYQIFLASKNMGGRKNMSICTLHCINLIDHVINMIDQARYCWEHKNSGILSKQNSWRSNVYSSFFSIELASP